MAAKDRPLVKDKEQPHSKPLLVSLRNLSYFFVFFFTWFLLLYYWLPAKTTVSPSPPSDDVTDGQDARMSPERTTTVSPSPPSDDVTDGQDARMSPERTCDLGANIYMYELPEKFNSGLLRKCRELSIFTDMCPHVSNRGLGRPMPELGWSESWYATNQLMAEMIFHARVESHPCRTWDPQEAALFYVPFYGGLHASSNFREPDLRARDRLAVELLEYLSQQPAWQPHQGGDHILALGRTAWDFMRSDDGPDYGANALLKLPRVLNMSVLVVERHPWQGTNQFGIPYPSYFHPSTWKEISIWQEEMHRSPRPNLFTFVGATRTGVDKAEVRNEIVRQCAESTRCSPLNCTRGASECHDPVRVLVAMSRSSFCMQPPGDSFTRRSVFDSFLAGCIPVFFSPHTAYTQYKWYLPTEGSEFSVYLQEEKWGRIEAELLKIPTKKVARMRDTVIDMIPRITYAHPNASDMGFKDAVDVALEHLLKHVQSRSMENM